MPLPDSIRELVKRYADNLEDYRAPTYKEFRLRKEFVDPFFRALGWDMENARGYAEAYKDVIHEDSIQDDASKKAPDYAFRIGGTRRFFVETKVPLVHIKEDVAPAYQLRRYGWSAKLPLSILTDFEEFAVYDTRVKPGKSDRASTARLMYMKFGEYEERWEEIESIFSREAVLKGAFDRFAQDSRRKRGTTGVDEAFLAEIEGWRVLLAKNIALRNKGISARDLNGAVQKTIDRIVFLRIAEDRGIEPYQRLRSAAKGAGVYSRLTQIFRQADERYNSGLFHFQSDRTNTETLDKLTLGLTIDDKILRPILTGLYYPDSPYEFSVLPADILGQVYEQFLGKVIRLSGRSAVVEDKPEVKKSGGVYYTPQHVVSNIVSRCLAPLITGLTPARASGTDARSKTKQPIRIVDPACGSGSFLIQAYQYFLDWYLEQYVERGPEKFASGRSARLYLAKADNWRLTINEKRRILLTHIFGVDIDLQAVEVTKLSLLLKLLEGENSDAVARQMDMFRVRALPDLSKNIKWGNSLVSDDLYDHIEPDLFSDEDLYRINPFNWNEEFKDVGGGRFAAVVGNPPYDVLEKDRKAASWPHDALSNYVRDGSLYEAALGRKTNLFRFFAVKAVDLLAPNGRFGMIMPMSLLGDTSSSRTREFLIKKASEFQVDCFPQKDNRQKRIFKDAKLSTAVYLYRKGGPATTIKLRVFPANSFEDRFDSLTVETSQLSLIDKEGRPIPVCDQESYDLCLKIYRRKGVIQFSELPALTIRRGEINQTTYRRFITSNSRHARLLKGAEVGRFETYKQLSQSEREWFDEGAYISNKRNNPLAPIRRIATQRITGVDDTNRIIATIIEPATYFADSTNSIHLKPGTDYSLEYVVALLNSRLFQWRFRLTSSNNNVGTNELNALPFRIIDFSLPRERKLHDEITSSVKQLSRRRGATAASTSVTLAKRQIAALEQKIEGAVFELYGLSRTEREIVETGARARGKR
jgi:Alw26I/Eco31I/Esp3I family type II restriction m6 adenine DNA methyltransferase